MDNAFQGDVLPRSLAKNLLRERVYQTCLDYFCAPPSCPDRQGGVLRHDTLALIRFWQLMHSDKKYLKQSHIAQPPESPVRLPSTSGLSASQLQLTSAISGPLSSSFPPIPRATRSFSLGWLQPISFLSVSGVT